MGSGPSYYCWSCYARVDRGSGRCPGCGGWIEAPPEVDYVGRLVWALDHPLAERRMIAARVLGQRREARATMALRGLARSSGDPYLASVAVEALVRIVGRGGCADLLAELGEHGPAPVRRTVAELLAGDGAVAAVRR